MSDIIFFCSRKIFEFPNRPRCAAYAPCRSCRHYVRKTVAIRVLYGKAAWQRFCAPFYRNVSL